MNIKLLVSCGVGLGLLVASASASTVTLGSPGATPTVPNNGTGLPSSGLVASITNVALTNPNNSAETATISEWVYSTPSGLDFFYQLTNTASDGQDSYNEVSMDLFSGFTTAVAYDTCTNMSQTCIAPAGNGGNAASRNPTGGSVNFFFEGGMDGTLLPGDSTEYLEIDTNATAYKVGGYAGAQDNGTLTTSGNPLYEPSTPEPVTVGLLGGGLAFVGLIRWRNARKA